MCVFVMLQWRPTYWHNMSKDRPSAFAQWLRGTAGVAPRGNRGMGQVSPSGVGCGKGRGQASRFLSPRMVSLDPTTPLGSLYPGPGVSGRCTQLTRGCAGQECFGTLLPGVPTHESQPGVLCQQTPPSQEGHIPVQRGFTPGYRGLKLHPDPGPTNPG